MSDQNRSQPPVAQNARSRKSSVQGDYVPMSRKPATPEEAAAAEARRKERRAAAAEQSKARAARVREWLKKRRLSLSIAAGVVVLLVAVAIVEVISANSGTAEPLVKKYVAALNAKDPSVFADETMFPLPDGAALLSSEILSQVDTSLVDPQTALKPTPGGAELTISATNLANPIILDLAKDIVLDGALLTSQWHVVTTLPTVTFSASPDLPGDAVVSIGTVTVGNSASDAFKALTSKAVAAPVGVVTASTSATSITSASNVTLTIGLGRNVFEFGAGAVNAFPVIQSALVNDDMSLLIPVMAKQVDVLIWPNGSGSSPRAQTLLAADAASALQAAYVNYMPLTWTTTPEADKRSLADYLAANRNFPEFLRADSVLAFAFANGGTQEGLGKYTYLSFTYDANGKIAKIWFGPTTVVYGSDFD